MKINREEMETIREDIWSMLDSNQSTARSDDELLNLSPQYFFIEPEETTIRQNLLKKIDKELCKPKTSNVETK